MSDLILGGARSRPFTAATLVYTDDMAPQLPRSSLALLGPRGWQSDGLYALPDWRTGEPYDVYRMQATFPGFAAWRDRRRDHRQHFTREQIRGDVQPWPVVGSIIPYTAEFAAVVRESFEREAPS